MKKLKLNLQQLNNAEVLTRSQLKNVLGGSGSTCTNNTDCAVGLSCVQGVCSEGSTCCITYLEIPGWQPVFVYGNASSESDCAQQADNIVLNGTGTEVHYDYGCDGH